jgi:class 3 adenylate cyclase
VICRPIGIDHLNAVNPAKGHFATGSDAAPWGMGWTRRIGGPEFTEGCTLSEAYARRLFLGLAAIGAPMTSFAAVFSLLTGQPAVAILLGGLAASNIVAMLVPVVTGGRFYRHSVHGLVGCQMIVVFAQVPLGGGLPHAIAPLFWGMVGPVVVALLLGPRAALVWWGIFAALILVATNAPDFPLERSAPIPRDLAMEQNAWSVIMATMGALIFLGWFVELRRLVEKQLHEARVQADRLLDDVLPATVAKRLKEGEETIADQFYEVTVLFADVVGFTPLSARLPPAESVRLLGAVFSAFDEICTRHGVEKIRTIGDGYMAVSGAPERRDDHAQAMARVALAMRDWLKEQDQPLKLRIGMNSGPAVGGVIGSTRFHYDLWGDAVNIASRMESHGEAGCIQIGPRTQTLLESEFRCEPRGPIEVKGRGKLDTFWLEEAL